MEKNLFPTIVDHGGLFLSPPSRPPMSTQVPTTTQFFNLDNQRLRTAAAAHSYVANNSSNYFDIFRSSCGIRSLSPESHTSNNNNNVNNNNNNNNNLSTTADTSLASLLNNLSLGHTITPPRQSLLPSPLPGLRSSDCFLSLDDHTWQCNLNNASFGSRNNNSSISSIGSAGSTGSNNSHPPIGDGRSLAYNGNNNYDAFEMAVTYNRTAAHRAKPKFYWKLEKSNAKCVEKLFKSLKETKLVFSAKVFLGGLAFDTDTTTLQNHFAEFGTVYVDKDDRKDKQDKGKHRGYTYLTFENEKKVAAMLESCEIRDGNYFTRIKGKPVQVIPWNINNSNYPMRIPRPEESKLMVFLGNLHGVFPAVVIYTAMNEVYRNVIYCGIDVDKRKYPAGSGRVIFDNEQSYRRAIDEAFVTIKYEHVSRIIQIDPYHKEDTMCSFCHHNLAEGFCREKTCSQFFCKQCWNLSHSTEEMRKHRVARRNTSRDK